MPESKLNNLSHLLAIFCISYLTKISVFLIFSGYFAINIYNFNLLFIIFFFISSVSL